MLAPTIRMVPGLSRPRPRIPLHRALVHLLVACRRLGLALQLQLPVDCPG